MRNRWFVGVIAGAVIVAAAVLVIALQPSSAPREGVTPTCRPDPAATIAALPPGATWRGSGCYDTSGILLPKPVTIIGGTFVNPATARPASGHPLLPIIRIKGAGVTVKNVTVEGANTTGAYHGSLVSEPGIELFGASGTVLKAIHSEDTYGDGLEVSLGPKPGPTTNLTVNGYTVTHAGRDGFSPTDLVGATIKNMDLVSSAKPAIDAETDLPAAESPVSSDIAFTNLQYVGAITFIQPIANVSFKHTMGHGRLQFGRGAKNFSFTDGNIQMPGVVHDVVKADIEVRGGSASFTGVTFTRSALTTGKPPTAPAWYVTDGGRLTLTGSPIPPPTGTHDATSVVTVTP